MVTSTTGETIEVPARVYLEIAIRSSNSGHSNLDALADCIEKIVDGELWREASTSRRGNLGPFTGFWDWVEWRLPDGMETKKDKLLAMLEAFPEVKRKVLGLTPEAGPVLAEGVVLNKAGVNQHTRKEEDGLAPNPSKVQGATAEGILARLKRDAPEIARAFVEGEYPSAAAAGRAAGIPWLQPKTPLQKILALIPKLTPEEREQVCNTLAD